MSHFSKINYLAFAWTLKICIHELCVLTSVKKVKSWCVKLSKLFQLIGKCTSLQQGVYTDFQRYPVKCLSLHYFAEWIPTPHINQALPMMLRFFIVTEFIILIRLSSSSILQNNKNLKDVGMACQKVHKQGRDDPRKHPEVNILAKSHPYIFFTLQLDGA